MKNVVLSQTCQGEVLRYMLLLSEPFRERYTCTFVPNYEVVDGKSQVAASTSLESYLPTCDILVYHAIVDYDFDVLKKLLPARNQALRVPYVTSNIYWPSYELRNPIWLAPYAYTALIPWPCRLLNDLIVRLKDKSRIVEAYRDLDVAAAIDVAGNFDAQIRYLQRAEAGTIFSVSRFVRENFRDAQLFHLLNHPGVVLFRYLANCLLEHLGLPALTILPDDPFLNHQIPVHPSLMRYYGLTWCDEQTRFHLFERNLTFSEYTKLYIDFYVERYGFDPVPPPKVPPKRPGKLRRTLKALLGRRR